MWSNLKNTVAPALNNAWEDDDDNDDLYDDDFDDEEDDEGLQDEALASDNNEEEVALPPPPGAAVAGRLMGRFTRFIAEVTHADDNADDDDLEEGDASGWMEDSEELDLASDGDDGDDDGGGGEQVLVLGGGAVIDNAWNAEAEDDGVQQQEEMAPPPPPPPQVVPVVHHHMNMNMSTPYQQGRSASFEDSAGAAGVSGGVETYTQPALSIPVVEPHDIDACPSTPQRETIVLVDHRIQMTPPVSPMHSTMLYEMARANRERDRDDSDYAHAALRVVGISAGNISLACRAASEDLTRDTGGMSTLEVEEIYDNEDELDFGPIVDHTPIKSLSEKIPFSRRDSLLVQAQSEAGDGWEYDADDDDDLDMEGEDAFEGQNSISTRSAGLLIPELTEEHVVDYTPEQEEDGAALLTRNNMSVGVLASECDTTHVETGEDAEDYGPVVDRTPIPTPDSLMQAGGGASGVISTANSMAVQALALEEDFEQDDVMDETDYGDSTQDGVWNQDDLDDIDIGGEEEGGAPVFLGSTTATSGVSELSDAKSADDDDDRKLTPIATRITTRVNDHVVDHLPQEIVDSSLERENVKFDPSVAVLVAQEDISRDTGDNSDSGVYDDENEMLFGPVVDQTPMTPSASTCVSAQTSGANSIAVQAPEINEEIQEDDAMDETAFGDDDEDDGWEKDDILDDEDMPGKTDQESGEEKAANGLKAVAMVDHTPSEMGTPSLQIFDPSVDVLASENASTKAGDNDSAGGDDGEYGLVVDQTPQTPAQSWMTRSDSVIVQAYDLDTVDETYGEEDDGDGDTVDSEMPTALRSMEDLLVDHVPRPESRLGDASTLVVADPSEILSEVDDMAQEEGNFGPVVDLTPPTRPTVATTGEPSATGSTAADGSTVVFVPASLAADDLDGDDTVTGGDQSGWDTNDTNETDVEEAPNPQSGNDEPAPNRVVNEQLVDFLPPEDEQEGSDHEASVDGGREASSELTLRGELSLMPNLDPKEDDFGPVVDLTPTPQPIVVNRSGLSHASTTTQLTASECRALETQDESEAPSPADISEHGKKVVVDHLPPIRLPVDSTASVGGSQLAEDEEDDSKFGPVVDHLPTPRTSLAPSRGGSTVDALATVSEVNSDDGGDGWDDDVDIDISESGVSDGSALQKAAATRIAFRRTTSSDHGERSVSVRFEATIDDCRDTVDSRFASLSQPQYFDPEMGANDTTDETQYFDPVSSQVSSPGGSEWADVESPSDQPGTLGLSDKSFAEAITPPSTPYQRRPESNLARQQPIVLDEVVGAVECDSCLNAKTIQCPCIQKLLGKNTETGALIGTVITPEGDTVEIDFSKLLQDEITKRQLIEDEVKSRRFEGSALAAKESELRSKVSALEQCKSGLERELVSLTSGYASLQKEKSKLRNELDSSRDSLNDYEENKVAWAARESALKAEIQNLKHSLDDSVARLSSDGEVIQKMTSMQSASKAGECEELNMQITQMHLRQEDRENVLKQEIGDLSMKLQQACVDFEGKASDYARILKDKQTSDEKAETSFRKVDELSAELERVHKSKAEQTKTVVELRTRHEADMQEQYKLLDKKTAEVRAQEATVESLVSEKTLLKAELSRQRSLAEQSESLAAELLSVAKERDLLHKSLEESKEAVDSLQKLVDEHGMETEAIDSRREAEIASLRAEVKEAKSALARKESEASSLSADAERISREQEALYQRLQESEASCRAFETEAENGKARCIQEEEKCSKTLKEMTSLRDQVAKLVADMQLAKAERQKATSHLAALGRTLERTEREAAAKASMVDELEALIARTKEEASSFAKENSRLASERDSVSSRLKDIEVKSSRALEHSEKQYQQLCDRYQQETRELKSEHHKLLDQLTKERSAMEALTSERNTIAGQCEEIEAHSARKLKQAEEKSLQLSHRYEGNIAALNEELRNLHHQLVEQHSAAELLKSERDALLAKSRDIETKSARSMEEAEMKLLQASQVHEKKLHKLREENAMITKQLESSSEELDLMRHQAEELLREKEALLGENEEMLVQFGLLEQQMNASEEQVRVLHTEIEASHASDRESSAYENEHLAAELERVASEKSILETQVTSLSEEREQLKMTIHSLESGFKDSELRYQQLEDHCRMLQNEISTLRNQLKVSSSSSALKERNKELELECESRQRSVEESTAQLSIIQVQLAAKESELHSVLQNLYEKDGRIRELEEMHEESADQLNFTRDQLAATEATLRAEENLVSFEAAIDDLEVDDTGSHAARVIADYDQRMKKLEAELNNKNHLVSALQDSVSTLQFQLEAGHSQASLNFESNLPAVEDAPENQEEINILQVQLESLESSLQATRARLLSKEEEVDRLSSELSNLQSREATTVISTSEILEKRTDDDLNTLRSHVVSLAVALERSETRRAEAISRLLTEREANATGLRRLSESVKRFYSSVSHREG